MSKIFITGVAGFIGYHLARRLLDDGHLVVGIDSLNDYYDPSLKQDRLAILARAPGFTSVTDKIETPGVLAGIFAAEAPDFVVHLAAQAGVRYSIDNPRAYLEANVIGTFELLEAARAHPPKHMLLASTSSAYGANTTMPYSEVHKADHQMSFYAATKKATEAMAHSYAHIYGLPVTMFRFFTVYGPWGRPDMAPMKFARAIMAGDPIDIYNHGDMMRDFTYVEDLAEGIIRLLSVVPEAGVTPDESDSLSPVAPWRIVNIGAGSPVKLMDFISTLEAALGVEARKNYMDMQPGDVPATWADTTLFTRLAGPLQQTPLNIGIERFATWYRDYTAD